MAIELYTIELTPCHGVPEISQHKFKLGDKHELGAKLYIATWMTHLKTKHFVTWSQYNTVGHHTCPVQSMSQDKTA